MTGKTISSTVTKPVTIGAGGYNSPLTITSTGAVAPAGSYYGATAIIVPTNAATAATIVNHGAIVAVGGDGSTNHGYSGGFGIDIDSTTTLTNTGEIVAGSGGFGSTYGGYGGIGVYVHASSSINNSGGIFGGGGAYGYNVAGVGGGGVVLFLSATLNNSGVIDGGAGGHAGAYNDYAYRTVTGGIGVSANYEAVITNTGHITGGSAGYTGQSGSYDIVGAMGATGAYLGQASTLTNGGTITGGAGSGTGNDETVEGGQGGDGVGLAGASASNTGLISGGAGAYGRLDGGFGGLAVIASNYSAFTNKGSLVGGLGGSSNVRYGGGGGVGLQIETYSTATNSGHITGGAGGSGGTGAYFGDGGAQGGAGVYVYSGQLTNNATIAGGAGATTPGDTGNNTKHHDNGGFGGVGIQLGGYFTTPGFGALAAVNYGLVRGGAGGGIISYEGTAGNGGDGANLLHGIFTNHGTIVGGAGGNVGAGSSTYIVAGSGGAGAYVGRYGTLVNSGTIIGGAGGTNPETGTVGGIGVIVQGGTFIDSGAVRGGVGGVGPDGTGARGDAILVDGTVGGTLVLNPGASFVGNVVATAATGIYPALKNVLEVAGVSSTALTGFGTSITGFNVISFASGANRTIEGTFASTTAIAGFAPHDTIVIDGFAAIPSDTLPDTPYLQLENASGSVFLDLSLTQAKDLLITEAGGKTTLASLSYTFAHTLAVNQAQLVFAGGTATNTLLKTGSEETVEQNGTTSNTTLSGGTLILKEGAKISGGISFSSVTGGLLFIETVHMPTATISGFVSGDSIYLTDIGYNSNDRVTVGTAGTVTIATPGISYKLDIAGATVGETDFKFSAGSVLTKTTAKQALTFISAPELTTSGTNVAPEFGGGNIFRAFAEHLILENRSVGQDHAEPTPAAAGALDFHEAHPPLFAHIS